MNKKNILLGIFLLAAAGMNAQNVTAEKSVIDMGEVLYRTPASVVFTLHNKSANELRLETVRTDCGCTDVKFPINGIAANSDFKIEAIYDAKTLGHFQKQIGVYEAGSDKPIMLTIKGVVVSEKKDFNGKYPYTIGDFLTDVDNVEFDDVNRGDRPIQRIHIQNKSDKVAEPQVMHLPPYLTAITSPDHLLPGRAATISVKLLSEKLRDYGLTKTTLYMAHNPGDKVRQDFAIDVATVLLPDMKQFEKENKELAPQLQMSATDVDFTDFGGKTKKTATVTLQNTGVSPLKITSLQLFTAGLKVTLSKSEIAPGQSANLKITGIAEELQKLRTRPRILMITNDPDHAKVVVNIKLQ